MRLQTSMLCVFALIIQASIAMEAATAQLGANRPRERRCAFLGTRGSFTVIGATGTAAYVLGDKQYVADLVSDGEEPNWWIYQPVSNGDPATTLWAFARFPRCGMYTVARLSNGVWRIYDRTYGWGEGLGQSGTGEISAGAIAADKGVRNRLAFWFLTPFLLRLIGPLPYSHMFQAYTWQGTLHVMISGPAYRMDLWEYYSSPVPRQTNVANASRWGSTFWGFNFQQAHGVMQISAPMWLPAIVLSAILLTLWRNHLQRRFSLRTLLIATTLIAVVMGIIVTLR